MLQKLHLFQIRSHHNRALLPSIRSRLSLFPYPPGRHLPLSTSVERPCRPRVNYVGDAVLLCRVRKRQQDTMWYEKFLHAVFVRLHLTLFQGYCRVLYSKEKHRRCPNANCRKHYSSCRETTSMSFGSERDARHEFARNGIPEAEPWLRSSREAPDYHGHLSESGSRKKSSHREDSQDRGDREKSPTRSSQSKESRRAKQSERSPVRQGLFFRSRPGSSTSASTGGRSRTASKSTSCPRRRSSPHSKDKYSKSSRPESRPKRSPSRERYPSRSPSPAGKGKGNAAQRSPVKQRPLSPGLGTPSSNKPDRGAGSGEDAPLHSPGIDD